MYKYLNFSKLYSLNDKVDNVKQRELEKIQIKNKFIRPRSKYKRVKPVIGLDTETEKGKAFVIGFYKNSDFNGCIKIKHIKDFIKYFCKKSFETADNFFWNLDYDAQALIKTMSPKMFEEMGQHFEVIYRYQGKEYKIEYMINKCFKITWDKKSVKFWDMAQYYGRMSLDKASKKYLGHEGKIKLSDHGIDIANLSAKQYYTDSIYKSIIDKYLRLDCKLLQELAVLRINAVRPFINPKHYYSQASFAQQYFLENLKQTMFHPPKKAMQYALYGYQGGRFETVKRGHFDKSYIYDIKSAYPYHCKSIPDTSKGKWELGSRKYEDNALISIFKVKFNIPKMILTPTKSINSNGILYFPYGNFKEMYINKTEYENLSNYCNVSILDAVHYYDDDPEYPYQFMEDFYYKKEAAKDNNNKDLALTYKTIINGFYGKTIQVVDTPEYVSEVPKDRQDDLMAADLFKRGKYYYYKLKTYKAGMLFNPVVANEITANARMQLFKAAEKNMDSVIGMQTDSILLDKKVDNLNFGNKLGNWDLEDKGEMLILGSGVYSIRGGRNKMRGMQKGMDLFDLLEKPVNSLKNELNLKVRRNNKLKKIKKSKEDFPTLQQKYDNFNLIIDDYKTMQLNFDQKRNWDRPFKNVNDALTSQILSSPIKN